MKSVLIVLASLFLCASLNAHTEGDQGGLHFVFGAMPEPPFDNEVLRLEWEVTELSTGEAASELTDLSMQLSKDGKDYGTYNLRTVRADEGIYYSTAIFEESGQYVGALNYRRSDEAELETVNLELYIWDRDEFTVRMIQEP